MYSLSFCKSPPRENYSSRGIMWPRVTLLSFHTDTDTQNTRQCIVPLSLISRPPSLLLALLSSLSSFPISPVTHCTQQRTPLHHRALTNLIVPHSQHLRLPRTHLHLQLALATSHTEATGTTDTRTILLLINVIGTINHTSHSLWHPMTPPRHDHFHLQPCWLLTGQALGLFKVYCFHETYRSFWPILTAEGVQN